MTHTSATTTTSYAPGVMWEGPPLFDRLMNEGGAQILAVIARRQHKNVPCFGRHLPGRRGAARHGLLRGLRDVGLIDIFDDKKMAVGSGVEHYKLTKGGWETIGQQPPAWVTL